MQALELNSLGLIPMTSNEIYETDGGLFPLLVIGACVLLAGCVQNNQQNGSHNRQSNSQTSGQNVGDSIHNSNEGTLRVSPR